MVSVLGQLGTFQTNYYSQQKGERVGSFVHPIQVGSYINVGGDVVKIATLALSTSSGNQTITIEGVTMIIPYNTSDAQTATDIAAAINGNYTASTGANPGNGYNVNSLVSATVSTATVIITGLFPGLDFTISYSGTGGTLVQDGTGSSQLAAESSFIPHGRAVGFNAGDDANGFAVPCRLPNGSGTRIIGVSGGTFASLYNTQSRYGASRGEMVAVLEGGIVVVELDTSLTIEYGEAAYYRHTANGALSKIGSFSNASGTGKTALTGAKFVGTAYTLDGIPLAKVQL